MEIDPTDDIAEVPPDAVPLSKEEIRTNNLPIIQIPRNKIKSVMLKQFKMLGKTD